jgi:glycosyltransferase involved in cell wall biosynthesis
MPSEPSVSVCMPVYNTERYVAEAVESILAQTFGDFEFIIIDDGSSDGSRAILERYAERDDRIRLISRPNTGIVGARNEALGLARGELIAVMDSDDVALPERLEVQVAYLREHPECVMVGSRVLIIDPDGCALTIMPEELTHEEIDSALMAAKGQIVYHASIIFRARALAEIGPYGDEYNTFAEDLDLFLRLAEVGQIANLAEPLLKYREHPSKTGHVRAVFQADAVRRAIAAAYRRRGLEVPEWLAATAQTQLPNLTERRRAWAWWALNSGRMATARKHAVGCLIRSPLSSHSWRLLYCALRGY